MDGAPSVDRRLVDKLIREVMIVERQTIEHAAREAHRLGEVPPVVALREVAEHAAALLPRLAEMIAAHELCRPRAPLVGLATLRHVVERIADPERAYRTGLLEQRHALEIVHLLRDSARRELVFGVIRWSDDWLATRRTLVARAEAQLAWFAERAAETMLEELAGPDPDDDWHADRTT